MVYYCYTAIPTLQYLFLWPFSIANCDKDSLPANVWWPMSCQDPATEQPPNFTSHPLRPEQLRSLGWMLGQARQMLMFQLESWWVSGSILYYISYIYIYILYIYIWCNYVYIYIYIYYIYILWYYTYMYTECVLVNVYKDVSNMLATEMNLITTRAARAAFTGAPREGSLCHRAAGFRSLPWCCSLAAGRQPALRIPWGPRRCSGWCHRLWQDGLHHWSDWQDQGLESLEHVRLRSSLKINIEPLKESIRWVWNGYTGFTEHRGTQNPIVQKLVVPLQVP